jgi:hypothetical protein
MRINKLLGWLDQDGDAETLFYHGIVRGGVSKPAAAKRKVRIAAHLLIMM